MSNRFRVGSYALNDTDGTPRHRVISMRVTDCDGCSLPGGTTGLIRFVSTRLRGIPSRCQRTTRFRRFSTDCNSSSFDSHLSLDCSHPRARRRLTSHLRGTGDTNARMGVKNNIVSVVRSNILQYQFNGLTTFRTRRSTSTRPTGPFTIISNTACLERTLVGTNVFSTGVTAG